jgi:hypothetical protein
MHVLGQVFYQFFLLSSKLTSLEDLFLKMLDLGMAGEFASKEQPKNSLRNGFAAMYSLGSLGLDLSKGVATVGNTFLGVKLGCLVMHSGETAHAAHYGSDSNFPNNCVTVFFLECRYLLLSRCDD